MIVVIDGPAASGKSSTAKAVAARLRIQYLDSGALYRTVTLIYLQAGKNSETFFELLKSKNIEFEYSESKFRVSVNNTDVSEKIRSMEVSNTVSEVASKPEVRKFVNQLMNEKVKNGFYIADGRDLGTAVFPNADIKYYMVADLETRAKRRYAEIKDQQPEASLEAILKNIAERDEIDSNRSADPLKRADDAVDIDTSNYEFNEQVEFISQKVKTLIDSNPKQ